MRKLMRFLNCWLIMKRTLIAFFACVGFSLCARADEHHDNIVAFVAVFSWVDYAAQRCPGVAYNQMGMARWLNSLGIKQDREQLNEYIFQSIQVIGGKAEKQGDHLVVC
jgi:hypothetical protein